MLKDETDYLKGLLRQIQIKFDNISNDYNAILNQQNNHPLPQLGHKIKNCFTINNDILYKQEQKKVIKVPRINKDQVSLIGI